MATPDIVLLILILISAIIGLIRGFIKEVFSLISWIAACILALYLSPMLANLFAGQFGAADRAVAFMAIFAVVLIVGTVLQMLLVKLIKTTGVSGTDRFLGFLFGSVRGIVISIVALVALQGFSKDSNWWQDSVLVPELLAFEGEMLEYMGWARQAFTNLGSEMEN